MFILDESMQEDRKVQVLAQAKAAKAASRVLAGTTTERKNQALFAMAEKIWANRVAILQANEQDILEAEANGQTTGRIDRLRLNEKRLQDIMEGLHQVASLPDPVGERLDMIVREDGLKIEKIRVPLGVIAIVYESRPNVTADAAGLAIKTGNAVVLRGGKEALRSNAALVDALKEGLQTVNLPVDIIQFINRTERESVDDLIQARGLIDLAIPRGGAGLITRVVENSRVPVIETGVGNCHVYVDQAADFGKAEQIVINAKTQRPSVCNAMETLLVNEQIAQEWLPSLLANLIDLGVEIRACDRTLQVLEATPALKGNIKSATKEDYATEFLDFIMAVKIVGNVQEAIEHINRFGTLHSEAIVTEDAAAAQTFLQQIDAAAVYHNASTRFTDGFEFGFGAEIGISTQKLHARGPMGLKELTSYKYVIKGNGHIRA